jgi:hypothetical protein
VESKEGISMDRIARKVSSARVAAAVAIVAVLSSCSVTDAPDPSQKYLPSASRLTGSIGAGFASARALSGGLAGPRAAGSASYKLWAFPLGNIDGSWPGAGTFSAAQSYDPAADGSFTIPLGNAALSWVYLVSDSSVGARKDSLVGFVSLSDASESLLSMQTKDVVEGSAIDCGALALKGDEASSSTSLSSAASAFKIDLAGLREIETKDNLLKSAKNNFVNYDPVAKTAIMLVPRFNWQCARSASEGKFSDPNVEAFENLGYYPQFSTDDASLKLSAIVDGSTLLELYPPVEIAESANFSPVYGPSAPFSSLGAVYSAGYGPADGNDVKAGNDGFFAINFLVDGGDRDRCEGFSFRPSSAGAADAAVNLRKTYPGLWLLKKNGVEIGWFDMAITMPQDASGDCNLYVPSLKVTVDGAGLISAVDVRFYSYDPASGAYLEVPEAGKAAMNAIVGQYMIDFMENGQVEDPYYTSVGDAGGMKYSYSGFARQHAFRDTGIQVGYSYAGVNLNFWWN